MDNQLIYNNFLYNNYKIKNYGTYFNPNIRGRPENRPTQPADPYSHKIKQTSNKVNKNRCVINKNMTNGSVTQLRRITKKPPESHTQVTTPQIQYARRRKHTSNICGEKV